MKFSKQYNKDRAVVKRYIELFHGLWELYNGALEYVDFGMYDDAKVELKTLIMKVGDARQTYARQTSDVRRVFVQKWTKKYGRRLEDPFASLHKDATATRRGVETRIKYLQQQKGI